LLKGKHDEFARTNRKNADFAQSFGPAASAAKRLKH